MNHYIEKINIRKMLQLSDIQISLDKERRQHLLLTGKNGSGKTTLLSRIKDCLWDFYESDINENLSDLDWLLKLRRFEKIVGAEYSSKSESPKTGENGLRYNPDDADNRIIKRMAAYFRAVEKMRLHEVTVSLHCGEESKAAYENGDFILAYFPADRKLYVNQVVGAENVKLKTRYGISDDPGALLIQYMVHLKTQQSYARNENDAETVDRVQKWFDRFESALRILLDSKSLLLKYNYKAYNFQIEMDGQEPFGFDQLADGYSSVIQIVSNLILRMDHDWLSGEGIRQYDKEGIVLIDELETHLHIKLQKIILPFLTEFFPHLQFIVATHSPYILNSISNAKVFDLEKQIELESLMAYSAEDLAEGYFDSDAYSEMLKEKINRYEYLVDQKNLSEEDRSERARLRCELKNISRDFSREAKDKFQAIEEKRRENDKDQTQEYREIENGGAVPC